MVLMPLSRNRLSGIFKKDDAMDNFKMIYKILRTLERAMDLEDFDKNSISKERLELTEARWNRIIAMLVAEGYVTGIEVWNSLDCGYPRVCLVRPEITNKCHTEE